MHEKLFTSRAPRYTSYPTAPHFSDAVNSETYVDWLSSLPDDYPISAYIHIPFCEELCWFCGCYTKITKKYKPIEKYLSLILKEIELVGNVIGDKKLSHLHFGGGSPTILNPEDFAKIINKMRENFGFLPDAEIAVEMDPRTFNEDKVRAYAECGVNRASIGVQDFNEDVQKSVNRIQPFSLVEDVIGYLRSYGVDKINMDLMYGLPVQTPESVGNTVEKALTLSPDRIALFGYAHVPWMKKHMRLMPEDLLPDTFMRLEMYEISKDILVNNGYTAIGLDHFAKEDDEMSVALKNGKIKRNFQGYTTDKADTLIGFGISSIGSLPKGYAQNTSPFPEYEKFIESGELPIVRGLEVTKEDLMRRDIINHLMCYLEADPCEIAKKHDMQSMNFSSEMDSLAELVEGGYVVIEGTKIIVNESGRAIVRVAASVFDKYLVPENQKHSLVV